jgi:predicted transcriptional regulator
VAVRLSVNLNDETAEALKKMADRRRRTVTETIKDLVSNQAFIDEEVEKGSKFIMEAKEGKRSVVTFN